eukprot:9503987-Pyramimonas_sp.AAC.1
MKYLTKPYVNISYHGKVKQLCESLRRNGELRTAILCGWMSAQELVHASADKLAKHSFSMD